MLGDTFLTRDSAGQKYWGLDVALQVEPGPAGVNSSREQGRLISLENVT